MGVLYEKVALVTGGGSGIGRATAVLMAIEGARIIVSDVNIEGGAETIAQIRSAGGEAIFIRADISKAVEVEALVAEAVKTYGRLNIAFNNAGVGGDLSPLHQKTEDEWELVMNVNLKGVWLSMKYEIPAILASGGGAIVNMASVAGLAGFRMGGIYSASKHGVIGLTQSAALELAKHKIRVNAVCPYFTDTPMVHKLIDAAPMMKEATVAGSPMKRLGDPIETAAAVVWLASDQASYVTGHAMPIDGGVTAG